MPRFIHNFAECHYAECHYAECHYAECRYAECRGPRVLAPGKPFQPSLLFVGKARSLPLSGAPERCLT
jgi:hypothetical protein